MDCLPHPIGEHIAHLVDIGFHVFNDFWCHPAKGTLLRCLGCLGHGTSCTEVADFCEQAQAKENISTFQVTMDHIVVVEVLHTTCCLLGPGKALVG